MVDSTRESAYALLEPHRKLATCKRAAGDSTEMMINLEAAADIIANLIREKTQ